MHLVIGAVTHYNILYNNLGFINWEEVVMAKKVFFKRIIPALIALTPFAVIKITELIWFSDQYLFEWMSRENYLYIWLIAALAALLSKWVGYVISFSYFVSFWMGVIIGSALVAYRSTRKPYGADPIAVMYYRFDKGFYIWIISFLLLMLGCVVFYLIRRYIRKRKERYRMIYEASMSAGTKPSD